MTVETVLLVVLTYCLSCAALATWLEFSPGELSLRCRTALAIYAAPAAAIVAAGLGLAARVRER